MSVSPRGGGGGGGGGGGSGGGSGGGGGSGSGGGGGGGGGVPSINKYNPLKLGFQMDVCLTVVEEMPVVDMPLPAISIN